MFLGDLRCVYLEKSLTHHALDPFIQVDVGNNDDSAKLGRSYKYKHG